MVCIMEVVFSDYCGFLCMLYQPLLLKLVCQSKMQISMECLHGGQAEIIWELKTWEFRLTYKKVLQIASDQIAEIWMPLVWWNIIYSPNSLNIFQPNIPVTQQVSKINKEGSCLYYKSVIGYVIVVTWPWGICLICMPKALRPAALGLQTYISGKSQMAMLQLLCITLFP